MKVAASDLDRALLELPEAEKRRVITLLVRSLLEAGQVVWPDNTTIADESGRELGVFMMVESPPPGHWESLPPVPPVDESNDETIPVEEFYSEWSTCR